MLLVHNDCDVRDDRHRSGINDGLLLIRKQHEEMEPTPRGQTDRTISRANLV
jgi:hypothetical protein